jgi:hypothetical protein
MIGESGKADKVLVCIPGAGGALSNWAGPSEESGTEDRRISSPWQNAFFRGELRTVLTPASHNKDHSPS